MMSENKILFWTNDSFLRWSDFEAESNSAAFEDSHSVIKYRYTWTVNSDEMEQHFSDLLDEEKVLGIKKMLES